MTGNTQPTYNEDAVRAVAEETEALLAELGIGPLEISEVGYKVPKEFPELHAYLNN